MHLKLQTCGTSHHPQGMLFFHDSRVLPVLFLLPRDTLLHLEVTVHPSNPSSWIETPLSAFGSPVLYPLGSRTPPLSKLLAVPAITIIYLGSCLPTQMVCYPR